jgi:hypothetical protein
MTTWQKVRFMREERYHDLNEWEKEFISDLYAGLDGVPHDAKQHEVAEYLTPRQISKTDEIWSDLGL